jgi:hypothetical protein
MSSGCDMLFIKKAIGGCGSTWKVIMDQQVIVAEQQLHLKSASRPSVILITYQPESVCVCVVSFLLLMSGI